MSNDGQIGRRMVPESGEQTPAETRVGDAVESNESLVPRVVSFISHGVHVHRQRDPTDKSGSGRPRTRTDGPRISHEMSVGVCHDSQLLVPLTVPI